jgi:hypothetical protein
MSFEINPCNAVIDHLKRKDKYGPNEANNLCYRVCKDWMGTGSNSKGTECYKNCKACSIPFIKARGKDVCTLDFQVPPVWDDVPSFYPECYYEQLNSDFSTGDDNDKAFALEKCYMKCDKYAKNNKLQCKEYCNLDMNAMIPHQQIEFEKFKKLKNSDPTTTFRDYSKDKPFPFYIAFSITAVILSIFLTICYFAFVKKN